MKNLYYTLIILILVSCGNNETHLKTLKNVDVDSLLESSKKNFVKANDFSKKSDSTITKKVDNTVKKIDNLETQVTELKKENNELKAKIDDYDDNGKPYGGLPISPN
jgi:peptidoglycan hydrolase CwlO-like protein